MQNITNKGTKEILDLGKQGPAWKDINKVKHDIATILSSYSIDEQDKICKELKIIWKNYTPQEKKNLVGIPYEVYKQVQANINNAPKGEEEKNSDLDDEKSGDTPVDTSGTPPIPDPVDPEENPNDVYGNEDAPNFDNPQLSGEIEVRTRGQKIKGDTYDYGKNYPVEMYEPDLDTLAFKTLENGLTEKDKEEARKYKTQKEQIDYIKNIIQSQRNEVEEKKEQYHFNHIIDECYDMIPAYLERKFGSEIAKKFNQLTDKKNIHLVGKYDFQAVAGGDSSRACGIFRNKEGHIYVNLEYLKTQEHNKPIAETTESIYPRIYREIKHIVIHELLHSKSVLNYRGKRTDSRRIGLKHINYKKRTVRGLGYNEATTEHLTQEILKYRYTQKDGLDSSLYHAPWISYDDQIAIVDTLINTISKTTGEQIDWSDFHKAMILRRYGDEKSLEGPTPLLELIRKVNGGDMLTHQKRPYFFQIIMDLCDYTLRIDRSKSPKQYDELMKIINEFIETQNISILQKLYGSKKDIFKSDVLLNANKGNFNNIILEKYKTKNNTQITKGKEKIQTNHIESSQSHTPKDKKKLFHTDGSEYIEYEDIK